MITYRFRRHPYSAFSAALDPNCLTEVTITATDRRHRTANKHADAQHRYSATFWSKASCYSGRLLGAEAGYA